MSNSCPRARRGLVMLLDALTGFSPNLGWSLTLVRLAVLHACLFYRFRFPLTILTSRTYIGRLADKIIKYIHTPPMIHQHQISPSIYTLLVQFCFDAKPFNQPSFGAFLSRQCLLTLSPDSNTSIHSLSLACVAQAAKRAAKSIIPNPSGLRGGSTSEV